MANPHNPVTIVTGGGNLVTAVTDGGNPVTAVTDGGNLVTLTTSGMNPVTFIGGASTGLEFHAPLTSSLTLDTGAFTPTFTRATTATVVDSTGTVISVASGEARFQGSTRNAENDWTTTGNSDGILIEEQRTNTCTYSEDLSNAAWVASNVTKSSDGVTLPDGTAGTAETLTASAGNGTLLNTITLASAANTYSVYLQRKTGTGNIDITLDNGATWTTKALSGAGTWDRVNVTGAAAANPIVGVRIVTSADAIQMTMNQCETGAFPTSYIPNLTTGATTRNADVLTYDYQPPALLGSMLVTFTPLALPAVTSYPLTNGNAARWVFLATALAGSRDGSTTVSYGNLTVTTNKLGTSWEDGAATERATYLDGSQINTGVLDSNGFADSATLQVGAVGGFNHAVGTYKEIKFYTDAKDQTFMEASTT